MNPLGTDLRFRRTTPKLFRTCLILKFLNGITSSVLQKSDLPSVEIEKVLSLRLRFSLLKISPQTDQFTPCRYELAWSWIRRGPTLTSQALNQSTYRTLKLISCWFGWQLWDRTRRARAISNVPTHYYKRCMPNDDFVGYNDYSISVVMGLQTWKLVKIDMGLS